MPVTVFILSRIFFWHFNSIASRFIIKYSKLQFLSYIFLKYISICTSVVSYYYKYLLFDNCCQLINRLLITCKIIWNFLHWDGNEPLGEKSCSLLKYLVRSFFFPFLFSRSSSFSVPFSLLTRPYLAIIVTTGTTVTRENFRRIILAYGLTFRYIRSLPFKEFQPLWNFYKND